jgi:hypothetical protein
MGLTFKCGMLALWVPWALPVEGCLESFLQIESLLSASGLFPSFWLALPSCLQVVERELIACGAVGFHFFMLLLRGNDDIAGVPTKIDDGMNVACGGVVEVATPLLVRLDRAEEPTAFLLDVICIFCLDAGWGYTVHCCIHVFIEWIKEVVIIVV